MTLLIGVDLGTTGGKAVLVDAAGEILATSWIEYPMLRPQPGWAENEPEDWVRGVQGLIARLLATARVDPVSVASLSIVAQRDPVVLIDEAGEVLTPSISWLDRRDPSETGEIYQSIGRTRISAISGVVPVPALTLPNLVWTKRHLPDVWRRTRHALPVKDYVIYRLTGEIATDISSMSRSLLNDYRPNTWSSEICGEAGIPIELLAEPRYRPWEPRATLSSKAAEFLGLAPGTILAAGGGDDQSATLGSGVTDNGDLSAGTGTASCWRLVSSRALADPHGRADLSAHVVPDRYVYEMTIAGTGLSLRWFRDQFGIPADGDRPATTYDSLVAEALEVPSGADGLLFFPFLDGSRLPYFNEDAAGVFFGITNHHRRAHFVRAILEGVAFQYPPLLAMLHDYVDTLGTFTIVDGEARSPAWNSIKADVIGRPIQTTKTIEAAAIGAAILAGMAAGVYPDARAGVAALVVPGPVVEPNPARHAMYERLAARYDAVYRHLDPAFHDASRDWPAEPVEEVAIAEAR
jgi:sugar (pentulose or hexulose) kinase